MRTAVPSCLIALILAALVACSPTPPVPTDLGAPAADMAKPADLAPQPPAASLASFSPSTVPASAATDVTITGVNCHFDEWLGCATVSFGCDVLAYTTLPASTSANSLRLNIQAGVRTGTCGLTIQPRAGQPGNCGAAIGPPLALSPAFSIQ
jgi:hypothetical protein